MAEHVDAPPDPEPITLRHRPTAGTIATVASPTTAARRRAARAATLSAAVTTYYFRRSDGTRGSTSDPAAIPSGATVMNRTTA